MAIPSTPQRTPQRALTGYTVGEPDKKPNLTSASTSQNVGPVNVTPPSTVVAAADTQAATVTIPAMNINTQQTVTQTLPMTFARLPIPFQPAINDTVLFTADCSQALASVPSGTVIASHPQVTPQAFSAKQGSTNGQVYTGPQIPSAQPYVAFNVKVSTVITCLSTAAQGTLTLRVNGRITDILG